MKFHILLICLLLAIGANSFTTAKAQIDVNDSLSLVDLYRSTNGHTWRHRDYWLTKAPVRFWEGITVTNNRVTRIYLAYNRLTGPLLPSIGNLTMLESLHLSDNHLIGFIPAAIGKLTNLTYLYLSKNHFIGSLPASFSNLKNLFFLELSDNKLSGQIPAVVGSLTGLAHLDLAYNKFSGPIPDTIGNLTNLNGLFLHGNQLSGHLPSTIANLTKLNYLYLNSNQLSGSIAPVGKLLNLYYLFLFNNQFTGSIPSAFGNMRRLSNLNISNNQLTGNIPASLGNIKALYIVRLHNNNLSDSIPSAFFQSKYLNVFDVSNNQLTGAIPSTIGNCIALDQVYLYSNQFTFNGMEYVAQLPVYTIYAPQATIPIHQYNNTLSLSAGGTLSNNAYYWFKVGGPDSVTIKSDSTFIPTTSGRYYAKVTNKISNKLTLFSDTIDYKATLLQEEELIVNAVKIKKQNSHHYLTVYPNPATNIIHIQANGTASITITNSDGKTLLTKTIKNSDVINISKYPSGTYYIQNKTTGQTQKVVITH